MTRRVELTRFLKSARARISPKEWGLPVEGRRTKGLRREEVATLSGMSVTWYTWFEQGREVQLSTSMLERLSQTLKLPAHEREFLFALAQHRPPPLKAVHDEGLRASTQDMLDNLPVPALVMSPEWNVIGWNALVAELFRDYGQLQPHQRNLFRIVLLGEEYQRDREAYAELVKRLTSRLKWDYSRSGDPAAFEPLIEEMRERSALFREAWNSPDVMAHLEGVQTVEVQGLGPLTLRHTSYSVEQAPSQRLVIFTPVGPESRDRLASLATGLRKAA